jgi:hypothetical protein
MRLLRLKVAATLIVSIDFVGQRVKSDGHFAFTS